MSDVDPLLSWLQRAPVSQLTDDQRRRLCVVSTGPDAPRVRLLVHHLRTSAELTAAGMRVMVEVGGIFGGDVPIAKLAELAAAPGVARLELSRPMARELDVSAGEVRADDAWTGPPALTGSGVIVGVIDSGIDFTHDCFRKADGTSRILALWDQELTATGGESAPAGYGYGVEYDKAALDAALGQANPFAAVRHQDTGGHGSHVAGIAAGNGRASSTAPAQAAGTWVGLAREADLMLVNNRRDPVPAGAHTFLGDSVSTLQAVQYLFAKADALNQPCVINLSQGNAFGPHDGTTLLERGIDALLGPPGRAMVKSAGNDGNDFNHATGTWAAGSNTDVPFSVPANDGLIGLDVWYNGRDRAAVTLIDPNGVSRGPLADSGTSPTTWNFPGGEAVTVTLARDDPFNHDNRITLIIDDTATGITQGGWTLRLSPSTVRDGRFHVWSTYRSGGWRFTGALQTRNGTITTPGTAREILTVGAYENRTQGGATAGDMTAFSSWGPTRDGRIKPDLCAPGGNVTSARSSSATSGSGAYTTKNGTSMAAPHVTGAVALLFERHPRLTARQVLLGLQQTARSDAQTGASLPDNQWGAGKLDVKALVDRAYPQPQADNWVRIQPQVANWPADPATPPVFEVFGEENGAVVIELAWDPAALIAGPNTYAAPEQLRYYSTHQAFDQTIDKADGSGTLRVQVPAQALRTAGNRLEWTMPAALWRGVVEEAHKAIAGAGTFPRTLYYRVRVQPTGATGATLWPTDDAIAVDPRNAPHMGVLCASVDPGDRTLPDPDAVDAMGGIGVLPTFWADWFRLAWRWLPDDSADLAAAREIFADEAFRTELTVAQRAKVLQLWLVAGAGGRTRVPELLDRRVWISRTETVPAVVSSDSSTGAHLVDHLLDLRLIMPHPDITGVRTGEQLVADVLTELLDPNGRVNQGDAGMCAPTSMQSFLIHCRPAEYARLLSGLLSRSGAAVMANGDALAVPQGCLQIRRYAALRGGAMFVRTVSELAFQSAALAYAQGARFPAFDPADAEASTTRIVQACIDGGLGPAESERLLEALFGTPFTNDSATPSAALRDRFLARLRDSRAPVLMRTWWGGAIGSASVGGHMMLAMRYDGGRVFFKNPQYPGSAPPTGVRPGQSANHPPRRYEDPTQTLESMGDSDLTQWLRGFISCDRLIP